MMTRNFQQQGEKKGIIFPRPQRRMAGCIRYKSSEREKKAKGENFAHRQAVIMMEKWCVYFFFFFRGAPAPLKVCKRKMKKDNILVYGGLCLCVCVLEHWNGVHGGL